MTRCDYCGTPLDDPYFVTQEGHTSGHCREYLKAALNGANRELAKKMAETSRLIVCLGFVLEADSLPEAQAAAENALAEVGAGERQSVDK